MSTLPNNKQLHISRTLLERIFDIWCFVSVVGIYPRFIEPQFLFCSRKMLVVPNLPDELDGLKIVHISDLHYSPYVSPTYLNRISYNIRKLAPDLILFTGDLISYSELQSKEPLLKFLQSLSATFGCFFIYGNHDYEQYVSLSEDKNFRLMPSHISPIFQGLMRLMPGFQVREDEQIVKKPVPEHSMLKSLLKEAGIKVLHNETVQVGHKNKCINITGLGDIMALQCDPVKAFANVERRFPTIVMSHNPDSYPILERYPGELFLFGHTHGGQVNIPGIWQKITPLLNKNLKSGLVSLNGRYLYINRGLGSTFPFRCFAPPEIALIILKTSQIKSVPVWQKVFQENKPCEIAYPTTKCTTEKMHG